MKSMKRWVSSPKKNVREFRDRSGQQKVGTSRDYVSDNSRISVPTSKTEVGKVIDFIGPDLSGSTHHNGLRGAE